jgi:hypothetical protein
MGIFGLKRKNPDFIPEPYIRGLQEYGEHLVGEPGGFNADLIADLDMMDFAQRDPAGFVEMLAARIGPDSGAYCLGASEVVAMILGLAVSTPAWYRIVDGAIEFLRSLHKPYNAAKPYLRERWDQSHSPDEW